jgi:hypothetical protein
LSGRDFIILAVRVYKALDKDKAEKLEKPVHHRQEVSMYACINKLEAA